MDGDSPFDGLSSLVRLSGASVPARARFVGEALITSTLSSLTLGLCSGMMGATLFSVGPLIPFLIGSWTGYTFGLVNHWRAAERTTWQYAREYPTIMAHSLQTEFHVQVPRTVIQASEERLEQEHQKEQNEEFSDIADTRNNSSTGTTLEDWIRTGGLGRLTWSILAAQSCRTDVEELNRQKRQHIMEKYQERFV